MAYIPKVLIIATHPIQYQVPWFQALALQPEINLEVVYITIPSPQEQGVGFNIPFQWDIPLLEGYRWQVGKGIRHYPNRNGFWAKWIENPVKFLHQLQPDVVILTGWHRWSLLQLLWACKHLKIPCIIRGESNCLKSRPVLVQWIHRQLLRHYDAFLVIGNANAQFYRNNGIAEDKLFACRYFIDNQRFAKTAVQLQAKRTELREVWKIPQDAVCFCYVGKLERKKRILDLLEALSQLLKRTSEKPIHLLVVGTGELMEPAKILVNTKKLPVTFAGFLNQSEISRAYVASDCLVLPSDYGETWGLVVNEAMACNLPAVVSDRVGCRLDLIEPGVTGEVFSFGNIQSLAEILYDLAKRSTILKKMGEQAYERVITEYSIERAVEGTLAAVKFLSGKITSPTKI